MERGVQIALVLAAALYIWTSGQELPPLVASHFPASGVPDHFMPRDAYLRFMTGLSLLVPLVVLFVPGATIRQPGANIKLPHREHWLSPEHREETLDFLVLHFGRLGVLVAGLMAMVHHLVLVAHASIPVRLPTGPFIGTLAVFLGGTVVWISMIQWRFRSP